MSDIEVVQEIYATMAARNFDRLFELIDEECVITQDAALPWGGRHVGHDGVASFAIALVYHIASKVTAEAYFMADGDVIQFGRTRGQVLANSVEFDLPEVHRWTIRNGKAVAAHLATDTPGMLEALAAPGVPM
jgi:ketosteroid isomerase-like protein